MGKDFLMERMDEHWKRLREEAVELHPPLKPSMQHTGLGSLLPLGMLG